MKDIQNQFDDRKIPINKVGIKELKYPVKVLDKKNGYQNTVATINMYVDLPDNYKGTHMSRFVEMLPAIGENISLKAFASILKQMKNQLNAASSHIEIEFPYFVEKKAPVSKTPNLMNYKCKFIGSSDPEDKIDIILELHVPILSVCPCSLEISDIGAHNQRGKVKLSIRFKKFVWIEDMIRLVEKSASCDVFSVLKRVDEKYITEKSFSNPKFVEDIVRDVAQKIKKDSNITWFETSVESFESIHNHNAYAFIKSE
jgi:GTP cyclohydrolase IB